MFGWAGYGMLAIMGKGVKSAIIPLPVTVRDAKEGRSAGPLLTNRAGERLSRLAAAGRLAPLGKLAGLTQPLTRDVLHRRAG